MIYTTTVSIPLGWDIAAIRRTLAIVKDKAMLVKVYTEDSRLFLVFEREESEELPK